MKVKITSIDMLKQMLINQGGDVEFYIDMNGLRSSKDIYLHEDNTYEVYNHIDDSVIEVTEEELCDDSITHIGTAIRDGMFYMY